MNALAPHAFESKDPSALTWPPTLPIEIALKTAPIRDIQQDYGYSDAEFAMLLQSPTFLRDLTAAVETLKEDGMSFKLKAKLIAEENLKEVYKMVRQPHAIVPPAVKGKLIEITARWAGYDPKSHGIDGNGNVGGSNALNIQINLGSDY